MHNELGFGLWATMLFRRMVVATLLLIIFWGVALASQRLGARYAVSIDALSNGGGHSASTSYRQVDSAIGQESACGPSVGTQYIILAGVVQPWPITHAAVDAWNGYH
jgi:hypothetical protein